MTARATFHQKDVERVCRGATLAGLQIARIRVSPDGTIDIMTSDDDSGLPEFDNPLDRHVHGKKKEA